MDDTRMKNFTSCFKDKPFLKFFFERLKRNDTARYADTFPFISICGRERNFIRCDDLPIVFTHFLLLPAEAVEGPGAHILILVFRINFSYEIIQYIYIFSKQAERRLSYAHAGQLLTVPFEPQKVYMSEVSGRVYHPAEAKHGGIGLVSSKLSMEISRHFEFDEDNDELNATTDVEFPAPSRLVWNGVAHRLDREWVIGLPNEYALKRTDLK